MRSLYRYAKKLYTQGKYKLAGDVVDMLSRRLKDPRKQREEHNRRVLEEMKQEDAETKEQGRMQSIMEQHMADPPPSEEELQARSPKERLQKVYEARVLYPSFDEEGAKFFDEEDGVMESLSLTREELEALQQEDQDGYIRILQLEGPKPTKTRKA